MQILNIDKLLVNYIRICVYIGCIYSKDEKQRRLQFMHLHYNDTDTFLNTAKFPMFCPVYNF